MRYRPIGRLGVSVSAVSLGLDEATARMGPRALVSLIYSALENGVNTFEVVDAHPFVIEAVTEALQAVERRLLFLSWRVGATRSPSGAVGRDFSAEALARSVESAIARTGADYLDALILDDPTAEDLSHPTLHMLTTLRDEGRARMLGVAAAEEAADVFIATGVFDIVHVPFSLISGWAQRRRLKAAMQRDMAVIGIDYHPESLNPEAGPKLSALWRGSKSKIPAAGGAYAFLETTRNWTAEQICLAYALTEPSLASVLVTVERAADLEALAGVVERELPPGVAALIEMARFGPTASDGGRKA